MTNKITFRTRGSFRVTAPDGRDLTPRLAKAHGLLLLLLTGTDGARGRAWVQDCLWSDRGQAQAAASIRQTLSVIRKSLGEYRDILTTDRREIRLDMTRVALDDVADADFAEGLDVRDAEFDRWLAAERAKHADRDETAEAPHPEVLHNTPAGMVTDRIAIILRCEGSDIAGWTGQVLADSLFLSLTEFANVEVYRSEEDSFSDMAGSSIIFELNCLQCEDGHIAVRLAVLGGQTRRQIWAGHCRAKLRHGAPPINDLDILKLIHSAVEVVTSASESLTGTIRSDPADELLRRAVVSIFTMVPAEVAKADQLLAQAHELRASPLYLAWRLQIRTIQRLERHVTDETLLVEEGEQLAAWTLAECGNNSMIQALLANAQLFLFRDPKASLHFAKLSVARNPTNAMASWSLSSALLYNDEIEKAYRTAVRGRTLALHSPRRFFWDLQQAAAAMLLGRTEECMKLLREILMHRPQFRPPLRYLLALEASQGAEGAAIDYVRRLSKLEPDFSVVRLFKDLDYPASLVHRTKLIEPDRVISLS